MKLEQLMLCQLAMRPWTGYELSQWFDQDGRFLRASTDPAQVYRTLDRLVRNGWVQFTVEPRENAPAAKVHALTPEGLDALRTWAEKDYAPPTAFDTGDFLARYRLLALVAPHRIPELFDTELRYRKDQIQRFRHRDRTVGPPQSLVGYDVAFMQQISDNSHQYGTASMDGWVCWLQEEQSRLQQLLSAPVSSTSL